MTTNSQTLFPHLPERLSGLGTLAENLWWSWRPRARMLFKMLDRQAWKDSGHNPDKMLRDLPVEVLAAATHNDEYLWHYDVVMTLFQTYMTRRDTSLIGAPLPPDTVAAAYFSAEYGLHRSCRSMPGAWVSWPAISSRNAAISIFRSPRWGSCTRKATCFRRMREDGWQEDIEDPVEREAAPISRVMTPEGRQLVFEIPLIHPPIHVAVWKIAVGINTLYLMDTDIEQNDPWNRSITARLYSGHLEQRLRQEIVLGIGGARCSSNWASATG
jgi:starch phosphorylase